MQEQKVEWLVVSMLEPPLDILSCTFSALHPPRCTDLREGRGTSSSPFLHYLTNKGETFLEVVEKIEKFLKEAVK